MLDIQGHRGCRGLFPENSIVGFEKAIELNVTTLEMDAVVSKDGRIIISHEPYMSHEICFTSDGRPISEKDQKKHNIYQLNYEQIRKYDSGSKYIDRFPDQEKLRTHKPSLKDVVIAVNSKLASLDRKSINYNIEIKRRTEWDNSFHPPYQEFADLLIKEVIELGILAVTTVQCFDTETLRYINRKYPYVRLVFLVDNKHSTAYNFSQLGFIPTIYSPNYLLVNEELVHYCKKSGILLIPWTVNEDKDILNMITLGVDGIISDYPDRVIKLYSELQ